MESLSSYYTPTRSVLLLQRVMSLAAKAYRRAGIAYFLHSQMSLDLHAHTLFGHHYMPGTLDEKKPTAQRSILVSGQASQS
jgi:hypothetical protein